LGKLKVGCGKYLLDFTVREIFNTAENTLTRINLFTVEEWIALRSILMNKGWQSIIGGTFPQKMSEEYRRNLIGEECEISR
jgi:hypothetical protein